MGVSPSGAADPISLRLGNRLLGNAEGAAALEMTLLGGTFLFPQGAIIALTGSDFGATLDGSPLALWTSVEVKPGQTLRAGSTRSGARSYLCVQGGIVAKPFLSSASTHLLSGLGGHEGRALRKGDALHTGTATGPFQKRAISPRLLERLSPRKILRVTPGPQSDSFPRKSQQLFYKSTYRGRGRIQSHGPSPGRPAHCAAFQRRDDCRSVPFRLARVSNYSRRPADHPVCGATNHWGLCQDCERDFRRPAQFGTTFARATRFALNASTGTRLRALLLEQEQLLTSPNLLVP